MKEKFKRRHSGHLGISPNDYGKVERSTQKSMRRENSHYLKTFSWFSLAVIAGVFSSILKFFFNNTSSPDYSIPTIGSVLPELIRQNNSDKKWYKTHVPKSMRKGLTRLETTQLRQKVYSEQMRYV